MSGNPNATQAARPAADQYVVVARRYRPQSFEQLVGQGQVSQALSGAITTNRVGHAYLFTGARGVGKTSTARIFAKALNCVSGPTPQPCNQCDICESIATGDDVDVVEIDGASNRGIDEIRQLRANVNVRPSRARFKIYIIDEVHMLTREAFNALLKTLEEPPDHVKFLFCTTDPEKIPITVLSRCQRFDFAPIETDKIVDRLKQIVAGESREADEAVLRLLARRAAGSMRDSQSLLEQLLAFCSGPITVDEVHSMLGTARSGRLAQLAERVIAKDAAGALEEVAGALAEGVDAGQLAEQLVGHFRDMMTVLVGGDAELLLYADPTDFQRLHDHGRQLGLQTALAVLEILDETATRMRQSTHVRTLLEIALVRACNLENLDSLAALIHQVQTGSPPSGSNVGQTAAASKPTRSAPAAGPAEKKSAAGEKLPATPPTSTRGADLTAETAAEIWRQALDSLEDTVKQSASNYQAVAISAPNHLVVRYKPEYTFEKERCERPECLQRIEQAVAQVAGRPIKISFELLPGEAPKKRKTQPSKRQKLIEIQKDPVVREAIELFDGEPIDVASAQQ